jgi:alkylation response protein AidB-like acyl-CoA dehydrogenase
MMFEWSDTDLIMRDAVRGFIDKEIRPNLDALETGELSPYPIARKLFSEFGVDVLAAEAVKTMLDKERTRQAEPEEKRSSGGFGGLGAQASMAAVLVSELAGVSIGLLSTIGVSIGLGATTIMSRGTLAQKDRWLPELMTLEKIAAWAITEPDSGSDAFGGMKTTVRRSGDEDGAYLLNGQKTFITNGPYADVLVVYAKLDDGSADRRRRPVLPFVLDAGMPGLVQGKPFKKMGMMSSPTGELFFDNVRLTPDRLLGETEQHSSGDGRVSARANFAAERLGVALMALGIINECHRLSIDYAKTRTLWGQNIGHFQLIQLKLAKMEVARINVQNMVFQTLEKAQAGRVPSLAEASVVLVGGRHRRGDGGRAIVRGQRLHGRIPGRTVGP